MSPDPKQIQLSASDRGITDWFFCFTCDEYVWDCDHLIDERLSALPTAALEGTPFESFAYDGKARVLEIEFRVNTPFAYDGVPLPPPPGVVQYIEVPRYVFTNLIRSKTARRQERYWEDHIRTRFRGETVRTVCRLPRVWRLGEARNIGHHDFDDWLQRQSSKEKEALPLVLEPMKVLLLRTLAPKRVRGLGGLLQCPSCESVSVDIAAMRHRNCLWSSLLAREGYAPGLH